MVYGGIGSCHLQCNYTYKNLFLLSPSVPEQRPEPSKPALHFLVNGIEHFRHLKFRHLKVNINLIHSTRSVSENKENLKFNR